MANCKSVKLEFSQSNQTQYFDVNSEKYGKEVHCTAKAAGKKDSNYFSSKFKFVINAKNKISRITNIHINDVTHIGKTDIPIKKCGKYHYYYEINSSDSSCSSSSSIIDDQFEQIVYDAIKTMLINATVTTYGCFLRVTLTLPNTLDSMCIKIRIGTDEYSRSHHGESSSCNDCSLSPVKKSSSSCSKSSSSCSKSSSTCSKSSSSCSSSSWSSSSSSYCGSIMQKIIKLIAWSAVISFIVYVLKKKFCVSISYTNTKDNQLKIEYKSENVLANNQENLPVESVNVSDE
jgi:hypothetical protein